MKFSILTLLWGGMLLLSACGSKQRKLEDTEHDNIKRIYEVRDASSKFRPGWIEDAELWAKQKNLNTSKFRFFSYETTPKNDRGIACSLAKTRAKSNIAGEISTFIEGSIAQFKEGSTDVDLNNPDIRAMEEFVEETLAKKTMAMIHGASINKKYWEQRRYLKSLGAKKDFTAYTCSVFVRVPSEMLEKLTKRASDMVVKKATDPAIRAKVEKALDNIDENFIKSRRGQI